MWSYITRHRDTIRLFEMRDVARERCVPSIWSIAVADRWQNWAMLIDADFCTEHVRRFELLSER